MGAAAGAIAEFAGMQPRPDGASVSARTAAMQSVGEFAQLLGAAQRKEAGAGGDAGTDAAPAAADAGERRKPFAPEDDAFVALFPALQGEIATPHPLLSLPAGQSATQESPPMVEQSRGPPDAPAPSPTSNAQGKKFEGVSPLRFPAMPATAAAQFEPAASEGEAPTGTILTVTPPSAPVSSIQVGLNGEPGVHASAVQSAVGPKASSMQDSAALNGVMPAVGTASAAVTATPTHEAVVAPSPAPTDADQTEHAVASTAMPEVAAALVEAATSGLLQHLGQLHSSRTNQTQTAPAELDETSLKPADPLGAALFPVSYRNQAANSSGETQRQPDQLKAASALSVVKAAATEGASPDRTDPLQPLTQTAAPSAPPLHAAQHAERSITPPPVHQLPPAAAQVAQEIIRRFDGGNTHFDLRLDPPELGRVDVRLEVSRDHRVTATVAADNPQALADMVRHARELEQTLQSAGLQLSDKGLSFDLRQGGEGRPHTQNSQEAGFANDTAEPAALEVAPIVARPIGYERWRAVRVDISI